MQQKQLENIRIWFDQYVKGFYGEDKTINANVELKDNHSRRTCKEILYLAEEMGLDENQRLISETIALLHDVGRFEQYIKYRIYSDAKSLNHCLLGLEILNNNKVLEDLEPHERQLIEKAIEYHGCKDLPLDLEDKYLLFSKLIRDADKLDAFFVLMKYYKQYIDNPQDFSLGLELPDEPGYSQHLVNELLSGRCVDNRHIRTLNDLKLSLLGWIYDVNFTPTLKRIKQCGYLEELLGFLPTDENIEKVREKILGYIDFRLKRDRK